MHSLDIREVLHLIYWHIHKQVTTMRDIAEQSHSAMERMRRGLQFSASDIQDALKRIYERAFDGEIEEDYGMGPEMGTFEAFNVDDFLASGPPPSLYETPTYPRQDGVYAPDLTPRPTRQVVPSDPLTYPMEQIRQRHRRPPRTHRAPGKHTR